MSHAHNKHRCYTYATRIPARNDAKHYLTLPEIARRSEGAKGSRGVPITPECVCARALGRVSETPEPYAPFARLAVLGGSGKSRRSVV